MARRARVPRDRQMHLFAPVAPRRVTPPATPRRPQVERDGERSPGGQSDYDRRLRDLDNKLEELLKKVKKLKDEQKPQASKSSTTPRRARSASPGTPIAF